MVSFTKGNRTEGQNWSPLYPFCSAKIQWEIGPVRQKAHCSRG